MSTAARLPGNDWQSLWFATRQTAWHSLAVVPSDEGVDVGTVGAQLVATGQLHGEKPIRLMNAQGIQISDVQPFVEKLVDATRRGEWVIVVMDPILLNPGGLPIAKAASHALLVVQLGRSLVSSARDAIKALGRERFLGSIAVDAAPVH